MVQNGDPPTELPNFDALRQMEPSAKDVQIEELQKDLTAVRDARREDLFAFILVVTILLDVVFFSVQETFAGPLALVVLQLLFLIPLAAKLGMQNMAKILNGVITRMAGGAGTGQ